MTITYLLDVYESAVLCKIKRHFLQYAFKALLAWRNNNFDILFFEACWFSIREFSDCRACQSQVSFLVVIMNPFWMVHGHRPPPPGSEMRFMKFGCVFTDTSLKISSCNEASKQPTFRLRLLCFAADWPGKGNRIVLLSQFS